MIYMHSVPHDVPTICTSAGILWKVRMTALTNLHRLQVDVVAHHELPQLDRNCLPVTVKTLNIGTPRPATVVVLNIKQFNLTMK